MNRHPHDNSVGSSSLPAVARSLGHSLASGLTDTPDVLVCVDWTKSAKRAVSSAASQGIPRVLIKLEPSVIVPEYQKARVTSLFTAVIEMGRPFTKPIYPYPQDWDTAFFEQVDRHERLVSINSNKYSFVPGELYSLRAAAYSGVSSLDLYGTGWGRSVSENLLKMAKEMQIASSAGLPLTFGCVKNLWHPAANYKGTSQLKLETLSNYKYSLVIENSIEFMTEKLVDSMLSGTMPIYVGPPVDTLGVPSNLFFRAAPNLEDIRRAISQATESNWNDWHDSAREWILDPSSEERWAVRNVNTRLIREIEGYVR